MHLLIPFASPFSEAGRQALSALRLPQLERLLARWRETRRDEGDENSLSPPHEREHARAIGLAGADGLIPWAALDATGEPSAIPGRAWGWLTPVHLQVGSDQVSLVDPAALALDEADSRTLLDALRELFTSEGFELVWRAPTAWRLAHPSLAELPAASLDRAIGRSIERWLPERVGGRLLRRLQNEVQMLLYRHPLNEAREANGLLPVNSVWLSGCGRLEALPAAPQDDLRIDDRLRAPALAEDWPAWGEAWAALDAGPIAGLAARKSGGCLSLCGERSAVELSGADVGLWHGLGAAWRRPSAAAFLGSL